jgi:hypothetical protein
MLMHIFQIFIHKADQKAFQLAAAAVEWTETCLKV